MQIFFSVFLLFFIFTTTSVSLSGESPSPEKILVETNFKDLSQEKIFSVEKETTFSQTHKKERGGPEEKNKDYFEEKKPEDLPIKLEKPPFIK